MFTLSGNTAYETSPNCGLSTHRLEETVHNYFEWQDRNVAITSALAEADMQAFPGAVVRGCRDTEIHTNRHVKRVSSLASYGPVR
jgi:hypothetical protein